MDPGTVQALHGQALGTVQVPGAVDELSLRHITQRERKFRLSRNDRLHLRAWHL